MNYDVILIHPPAIYDFRKKPVHPGPIGYTVGESTDQFIIPAIGILSIADYLDRNGYKVIVDNIGERMVSNDQLDVEAYIRNLSAKIYAIGLHWCVHCQGAIEIAKLCKQLHPDALVIMGGLTATVFSEEIIQRYPFVDAVIRGEAEKAFLYYIRCLDSNGNLNDVPNLTFRNNDGKIVSNPVMEPDSNLDEFEFTRLDLLTPKKAIFSNDMPPHWVIPICRGCSHNCVTCGGSAYSYRKYLGRNKPAFRSPEKITQDMLKLTQQGIEVIFLFQDPHMGGQEYWSKLLDEIKNKHIKLTQLSVELFGPAEEDYIRSLAETGLPILINISPESLVEDVRKAHGRNYKNSELFNTIRICNKYGIATNIFSMIALSKDNIKTIKENWDIWEQICMMNKNFQGGAPTFHSFGPMILLDPGSQAFNFPKQNNFILRFKNLKDYIDGMSLPSWHQWISYETESLNRDTIIKMIIDSIEHSINLREKYGLFSHSEAYAKRMHYVLENKRIIDTVNRLMDYYNEVNAR